MRSTRYQRVIPRDLFNEANLLKCMGKLWIVTERFQSEHAACPRVKIEHDGRAFQIAQDDEDGSLTVENVRVWLHGQPCTLKRPLNSRRAWPLYLYSENGLDEVEVFDEDGNLSAELLAIIER